MTLTAAYTRARALLMLRRPEEAAKIFQRLSEKYPSEPRSRAGLLEARLEIALAKDPEDAAAADTLDAAVTSATGNFADTVEGNLLRGRACELRRDFGRSMITALVRIEGKPMGVIANDPAHLGGAIDSDAADKAARFMQLCDAFDLPILFLCDTPGIMVGPEIEKTGLVRHAARLFVTSASLSVPFMTIVLRKGYGLGAQTMAGGSFKAPLLCVAWPTGEFGGMGLEGAVKLGYRNELAAIEDPEERRKTFEEMVDRMYQHGKATNMASHFEIDDVIDPMESRRYITRALTASPPPPRREHKKRPNIDTW